MHAPWNPLSLIAALYNRWSKQRDRRAEACSELRRAFHRELKGLYPRPSNWPKTPGIEQRLRQVFPALQAAVETFRSYVPDSEKAAFDEAWLIYRTSTKREIDIQDYTHYMDFGSETRKADGSVFRHKQDGRANFKRNVDRLLAFARDV